MKVDQKLIQAAIDFVNKRFPSGVEGAAAVYLEDGQILISTAPAVDNDSVSLCHETGAICEAYKLNKKITASVCVSRDERGFSQSFPVSNLKNRSLTSFFISDRPFHHVSIRWSLFK